MRNPWRTVGGTDIAELVDRQTFAEGILRTDKDDITLFQFGITLSPQEVIDIHEALVKVQISSLLELEIFQPFHASMSGEFENK